MRMMKNCLQDRPGTGRGEADCEHHNWFLIKFCRRVREHKCGESEPRNSIFANPFNKLSGFELFAVH